MRIVSKFFDTPKNKAPRGDTKHSLDKLTDGALDTLSNVIDVMGKASFPLESDLDEKVFPEMCAEFARHIENGAAVPSFDIPASADGTREWGYIRRFFADRRQAEKAFVTERLQDYRGIVTDLVAGLRSVADRNQDTEDNVIEKLMTIEDAVGTGVLPKIREALNQTISEVYRTFAEQKKEYEQQLSELHKRMSCLREDLVTAREEMKRDPLTEAYNRRAFDASILTSLNLHFIMRQPVTVIMVDLDNFKTINDTFGHAAGDEVLKGIGECLARSFIRKNDVISRYGGDEFAVILNDTTAGNAERLIATLQKNVQALKVPYADEDFRVSCSIGYTEIVDNDTVDTLINRADKALYAAKSAGRNCARQLLAADLDGAVAH